MKSIVRRPSLSLPVGLWKKLRPYGGLIGSKEADMPPVSEFESPKLYIAGKSQGSKAPLTLTLKHNKRTNPVKNSPKALILCFFTHYSTNKDSDIYRHRQQKTD